MMKHEYEAAAGVNGRTYQGYSAISFDRSRSLSFPSERSVTRNKCNVVLTVLLTVCFGAFVAIGVYEYRRVAAPRERARAVNKAIKEHAAAAALRQEQCQGFDWESACDKLEDPGARRLTVKKKSGAVKESTLLLDKDDVTVTYDSNCLRTYRLNMFGNITFPYHASQLLVAGGKQTMALFIQHGAMRDAPNYFCSFKKLMLQQKYRPFSDILVIAPDFNYEYDDLVHPNDAFWNSSKPWGDWRVGAESDPRCCGNSGRTVSSFEVLDHMLVLLTDQTLFPNMTKISFVGHSAGGQMVQRYAVLSILAALWDYEESVAVKFIIANPSSYTYLGPERFEYTCGHCDCHIDNCTCDRSCDKPSERLSIPRKSSVGSTSPCYIWNYDRWPYGVGSVADAAGHTVPYSMRDGVVGTARATRLYRKLHVVYMVGQNDTCNDGLPTCDSSCWKRKDSCFRNSMDTRCAAMLQGPNRRTRGYEYMKYLEWFYGKPTHILHTIEGVGHNATGMFSSDTGLHEMFA